MATNKHEACKKDDNFFNVRFFYQAVEENASLPVQQTYET
jgi:hypothetical protein